MQSLSEINKDNTDEKNLNEPKKKRISDNIDVRAYAMLIGLVIIWTILTVASDGIFLNARNISNLAVQMSVVAILGVGMVLVIVTGNIDLSVGSLLGLVGGIAAALMTWHGWGTVPTIIVALLLGLCLGSLQGAAVVFMKVPAFIVTLGGMMVFRGALIGISKGISIAPLNPEYLILGQAYLSSTASWLVAAIAIIAVVWINVSKRKSRAKYNLELESLNYSIFKTLVFVVVISVFAWIMNAYRGLPVPVLIMLSISAIFAFVTQNTQFGRYIYAIGGNLQASLYSGLNVKKVVLTVFAINGVMAAIAGIIFSARLNAGAPGAGTMMELDAIAAAVIGGTSLMGGRGKVFGAILGALIMASLDNGMSLLNIQSYWQYIVKGLILVFAVWFDVAVKGTN